MGPKHVAPRRGRRWAIGGGAFGVVVLAAGLLFWPGIGLIAAHSPGSPSTDNSLAGSDAAAGLTAGAGQGTDQAAGSDPTTSLAERAGVGAKPGAGSDSATDATGTSSTTGTAGTAGTAGTTGETGAAVPGQDGTSAAPTPTSLTTRFLVGGQIFWGRYVNDWAKASDLGYAFPFSQLKTLHRDRYDAWIAGLECPSVPGRDLTSAQQEATLTFNCLPEYLPEAAKWFSALTLGNNHSDGSAPSDHDDTVAQLDKAGIQHFGHQDPNLLDQQCGIVTIPATIGYGAAEVPASAAKRSANAEIPLVMCGFDGVYQIIPPETISVIDKYKDYLPVIALPHSGAEYVGTADQIKTDTFHAMIDHGADMVLGDHPHWIQPTEAYKGKLIVYSMGNLMFDQQTDVERTRSAAIDITARASDSAAIAGWTAIAAECREQGVDRCVELARLQGLPRLNLTYRFGVIGTSNKGHPTKKATAGQLAAIKDRLRWNATMKKLGQ